MTDADKIEELYGVLVVLESCFGTVLGATKRLDQIYDGNQGAYLSVATSSALAEVFPAISTARHAIDLAEKCVAKERMQIDKKETT
jgi:hypothetical protein